MSELAANLSAPDVAGEIEAWRAFYVLGPARLPRLFSLTLPGGRPSAWTGRCYPTHGWLYASCTKAHDVPAEGCTCGIYALATRDLVVRQVVKNQWHSSTRMVLGRVALAGLVIPGDKGFRAERARLLELFIPFELWRVAEPLAAAYRVPYELSNVHARERKKAA